MTKNTIATLTARLREAHASSHVSALRDAAEALSDARRLLAEGEEECAIEACVRAEELLDLC